MKEQLNVLLCGIGGQGIVFASKVLCEALSEQYEQVVSTDIFGVGQRGGSVVTHIRAGKNIYSHQIPPGSVDVIIGFEQYELTRWIDQLNVEGAAVCSLINIKPNSIELGLEKDVNIFHKLDSYKDKLHYINNVVEGTTISMSSVNVLLLGAVSNIIDVPELLIKNAIKNQTKETKLEDNIVAFDSGVKQWRIMHECLKTK